MTGGAVTPSPTPLQPVQDSMFAYVGDTDVFLCCRMTDGSVRSLGGVIGGPASDVGYYQFDFSPSPLPIEVTSPEQIDFAFSDGVPPQEAPFPTIGYTYQIHDFQIIEGDANYTMDIWADGVRVSVENILVSGDSTPMFLRAATIPVEGDVQIFADQACTR